MSKTKTYSFSAILKIIGINPYVSVPGRILKLIFIDANKDKGPIPVRGLINNKEYTQTLMKYAGEWRLYINTSMLKDSPKRIGEKLDLTISFDPDERKIEMHPLLKEALNKNKKAAVVFGSLSPSRQKEVVRHIAHLKTEEKIKENIQKAINFLLGKGNFAGREKP